MNRIGIKSFNHMSSCESSLERVKKLRIYCGNHAMTRIEKFEKFLLCAPVMLQVETVLELM
jgi:hypothetical protein